MNYFIEKRWMQEPTKMTKWYFWNCWIQTSWIIFVMKWSTKVCRFGSIFYWIPTAHPKSLLLFWGTSLPSHQSKNLWHGQREQAAIFWVVSQHFKMCAHQKRKGKIYDQGINAEFKAVCQLRIAYMLENLWHKLCSTHQQTSQILCHISKESKMIVTWLCWYFSFL